MVADESTQLMTCIEGREVERRRRLERERLVAVMVDDGMFAAWKGRAEGE
jgi:hypothetical protein